ncbi:MAG TPA: 50S ribosomal protein L25/general stress protein Ctc [Mycobacteriales bacterium]|nr:50S ribosomal protein L25/general stress protein Ctc [Mycobacteriales bacterium]
MADQLRIPAEVRTEFGKGAARRTRRDGKVPAVLYGHGADPVHLSLPGHELMLALKNANALLTIDLPGKEELALAKAVQRDPIKGFLEHVDLLLVRRGEKVTVEVAVHLVGEAAPDTLVNQDLNTLTVEAEATNIPTEFEVSIEGLGVGDHIAAHAVALPEGSTLVTDADHLVVSISAAQTAEALEAEMAEAEADAGVERDQPEPEQAEESGGSSE